MTAEDVQDELRSLVEAKTEGLESSVEGVIGAIQKTANSAGEFYDQVLRWKRIPRAFAVMKDSERKLVTSAALSRWLNSELSRPGVLPNDEPLDEELVGYVVGLLEHPDFCQPDLLVLELHEFLGSSVTKIVLALWKFMIIEIGLQSVFKAEKTEASNQIQVNFTAKSREPAFSATASQPLPADSTIERDFKRRRASYRGKIGTKTGPAAFREMIQKHMIGLSVEMDRELVLGGGFQDDVTSDKGPNKAQLKRHAPVNWREFTDALEVRNRGRSKCHDLHSNKRRRSKSRSRSRGRSHAYSRSSTRSTSRQSRSPSSSRRSCRRERDRHHGNERRRRIDRSHHHRRDYR